MKANETPERNYVHVKGDKALNIWNSEWIGVNDIEYIRTDDFIEKALKWYCLDCECNDNCKDTKCFFYREFERYLKGKENCLPPKFSDVILNEDGSTSDNWRYRHFIRKMQDAFIGKAFEFFGEHLWEYIDVRNANCDTLINIDGDKLKEDFGNYIKGE